MSNHFVGTIDKQSYFETRLYWSNVWKPFCEKCLMFDEHSTTFIKCFLGIDVAWYNENCMVFFCYYLFS